MKSLIRVALTATLGIAIAACGGTSAAAPPSGASPTPGARGAARNGASGELVQINGPSLILSTQAGDVTVTFAAATTIQKTSTASVADITSGSCIIASGQKDATGQLVATTVRLSPAMNGACTFGNFGGGNGGPRPTPSGTPSGTPRPGQANLALARGRVASVNGTLVTVTDSNGASQTISVPTTVRVARSATATTADLVVGACVTANGTKDSSGNVTARALSIVPAGPSGCFTGGRGAGGGGGGGFPGGGGGGGFPGGGPPAGG